MRKDYDVVVVGGGPAGMMAAARAAECGAAVLLLEKNRQLGKKMLITGGGRCNLTNAADIPEMVDNIPGNGRFVYSSLHRFSGQQVRAFFGKLGIKTKVEDHGRIFPVNNRSGDVVGALERYLRQLGVRVRLETGAKGLVVENHRCQGVAAGEEVFTAGGVIVATGGLSYAHTGSTGEGHRLAEEAGHRITALFPAAVAITCSDGWIKGRAVQGLSLENVNLTLYNGKGKRLAAESGDVIFTHWGLSGPGALRVGRVVALEKQRDPAAVLQGKLDLFSERTARNLEEDLQQCISAAAKKSVKNLISSLLPERLVKVLLDLAEVAPETPAGEVIKARWNTLISLMKGLPLQVTGTRPLEEATVTGGGVSIKEINPRTMESTKIKKLYFAGEILDVDAHTGGFNMQVAFSTGYVAGEAAATALRETLDEVDSVGVNYD
ncbi:HI0933 family protein [Desulforamulus ruminis DSM 2154]|uniref:HI0933 family protein n=1 Tax=Desulforamulus ruminis (strain ATCC 23193 / DSM 2154 / NCIMB 8452 / DL) TaxID=696281 RepID=F6DRP9_DESRL|nr:HI0933 family protein [Desulforamulus ruminis DSM 2154]